MQGAKIENEGSVLKYMVKSEIDVQRSSLCIMTQHLFFVYNITYFCPKTISIIVATVFNIVATRIIIVFTKIGVIVISYRIGL